MKLYNSINSYLFFVQVTKKLYNSMFTDYIYEHGPGVPQCDYKFIL